MLMSAVYSWGRAGNPPTPNSSMSPPPTTPPDSAAQQIGAAAIWRRAIRYCRPPPLFPFSSSHSLLPKSITPILQSETTKPSAGAA